MIYAIQAGDFIKLGYSANPRIRLCTIKSSSPLECVLLGTMPGATKDERRLHRKFANLRTSGEWFRADAFLLGWIAENMKPLPEIARTRSRLEQQIHDLVAAALDSGWSMNALCKSASVSRSAVRDWFYGAKGSLTMKTVQGIANFFETELTEPIIPNPHPR